VTHLRSRVVGLLVIALVIVVVVVALRDKIRPS
jgi:hypothetical protein